MSIKTIITTSGFVIPDNEYFIPIYTNNTESLNKLKSITSKDKLNLLEIVDKIHISHSCDLLYSKYLEDPSYDNLLEMVLITCDIIKDIDVHRFFLLQTSSKFLSPISFQFCRDIVNLSYLKDFRKYNVIPCTLRSDFSSSITGKEFNNRASIINKELKIPTEWFSFLPIIIENKSAFVTFFKYIFVDNY